ncbi:hypothetical protein LX64_00611 [Chitinophaga skermanii]|uniref:Uncharacterized protein n=1 Tax=Chitinophaga skermanii TaxID=331697 RepID=A0A327R5N5_9BACT|nr:hypothetical protein LX64_00611 [Chitinophaga skermanii]
MVIHNIIECLQSNRLQAFFVRAVLHLMNVAYIIFQKMKIVIRLKGFPVFRCSVY